MANQQNCFYLFLVLFSAFAYNLHAFQFIVGGRDGWILDPSENYNHWAERMRFQVNDTLVFNYKKGSDSVLVVNKDDYEKCNSKKPISKLEDGSSIFKFDRSGPFYFISGGKSKCIKGQKLIIVVLAIRNHCSPPPSSPASASASSPSFPSPLAEAPIPAIGNGPSPGSDTLAGVVAVGPPPHRSFATPACIKPSVVLVSTVSIVLSVCFGGFTVSSQV